MEFKLNYTLDKLDLTIDKSCENINYSDLFFILIDEHLKYTIHFCTMDKILDNIYSNNYKYFIIYLPKNNDIVLKPFIDYADTKLINIYIFDIFNEFDMILSYSVHEYELINLYFNFNEKKNIKDIKILSLYDTDIFKSTCLDKDNYNLLISGSKTNKIDKNFINIIKDYKPDIFLVESIDLSAIDLDNEIDKFKQIIDYCQDNNIINIFINHEKNDTFYKIIDIASLFDNIYFIDDLCFNDYNNDTNKNIFKINQDIYNRINIEITCDSVINECNNNLVIDSNFNKFLLDICKKSNILFYEVLNKLLFVCFVNNKNEFEYILNKFKKINYNLKRLFIIDIGENIYKNEIDILEYNIYYINLNYFRDNFENIIGEYICINILYNNEYSVDKLDNYINNILLIYDQYKDTKYESLTLKSDNNIKFFYKLDNAEDYECVSFKYNKNNINKLLEKYNKNDINNLNKYKII